MKRNPHAQTHKMDQLERNHTTNNMRHMYNIIYRYAILCIMHAIVLFAGYYLKEH